MFSRRAGFTIIELMITVVVIAVLITIAAPSLRDLILNARMTGLANNLMTDLAVARSEAVKRGSRTGMCPSTKVSECTSPPFTNCQCTNTDWNLGWLIFQDSDGDGLVNAGTVATDVIKYIPKIDGATDVQPNTIKAEGTQNNGTGAYLRFMPSGMLGAVGGATSVFHLCDSRSQVYGTAEPVARYKGRKITITPSGRAAVTRCTCETGDICPP